MSRTATTLPPELGGGRGLSSHGLTSVRESPVLQPVHRVFVALLFVWGASGTAAMLAGLALCAAAPILGWSIAPSLLLATALQGALLWVVGVFAIFGAWAVASVVGYVIRQPSRSGDGPLINGVP